MNLARLVITILVATLSTAANAAVVASYTDRTAFLAALPGATSIAIGTAGVAPVIVPSVSFGQLTLSAATGQLAGDGGDIISTELDQDILTLDFATPIRAIGLSGGVVDELFGFIDGTLTVTIDGETRTLSNLGGAGFLGLVANSSFSQLTLSVDTFDVDASSVAFTGLQGQVDVAVVPEPTTWLLMILGFGMVGAAVRRSLPKATLNRSA